MPSAATTGTKSGIITTENGERHIPASVRADGSTRKEIRVRPGYKPPEDVEVYKNRTAAAWKTRASGGVPGAEGTEDDAGAEAKASNKNAKRREARKRAKATEGGKGEDVGVGAETQTMEAQEQSAPCHSIQKDNWRDPSGPAETGPSPEAEREKQARKLKKKLREARELKEKKDRGEVLLHEQFEKVIRINELIRDLDKLGIKVDADIKSEQTTGE